VAAAFRSSSTLPSWRARREAFAALARSLGAPLRILDFRAGEATLRVRVRHRAAEGHDASEANLAVLDYQLRGQEPLTPDEQALTLHWDTECPDEAASIAAKLERLAPHPARPR
jgi:predicted kinase